MNILNALSTWVEQALGALGYPGLIGIVFLENLFPPIPSEVVLPLAGFLSTTGVFNPFGAVAASTLGAVTGAVALYLIGAWLGEPRLRRLVVRFGRYLTVSEADFDRALTWFNRYGTATVFFAREVPLVRSLISIPAGIARMSMVRFIVFTTLGTVLWNSVLVGLGYLLGVNWPVISEVLSRYEQVVVALLAIGVVAFLAVRVYRRRSDGTTSPVREED